MGRWLSWGRWGPDPSRWRWGAEHRVRAEHPLAAEAPDAWPTLDVDLPGDGDTVRAASYGSGSFRVTGVAVARYVFDVGAWDQLLWAVPGGTAEQGPAALNQLDAWAAGKLLPMWYSEEALRPHVISHTHLVWPGGDGSAPGQSPPLGAN